MPSGLCHFISILENKAPLYTKIPFFFVSPIRPHCPDQCFTNYGLRPPTRNSDCKRIKGRKSDNLESCFSCNLSAFIRVKVSLSWSCVFLTLSALFFLIKDLPRQHIKLKFNNIVQCFHCICF